MLSLLCCWLIKRFGQKHDKLTLPKKQETNKSITNKIYNENE